MALIKCAECGTEISSLATACPKCGAPPQAPAVTPPRQAKTRPGAWIALSILAILALFALLSPSKEANPVEPAATAMAPAPAKPPEPTEEEKAELAKEQLRSERVIVAANHVKQTLRDPDSLKWDVIAADDTGHVICMGYRAKNGFGGTNRVEAVVVGSKISKARDNVRKYCKDAAGFTDMKPMVEILL